MSCQVYSVVPDNKIELTTKGLVQALKAGQKLRELVGDGSVLCFVSPFRRTLQTLRGILVGGGWDCPDTFDGEHPTTWAEQQQQRLLAEAAAKAGAADDASGPRSTAAGRDGVWLFAGVRSTLTLTVPFKCPGCRFSLPCLLCR